MKLMLCLQYLILTASFALLAGGTAENALAQDAAAGQRLALQSCSTCHQIDGGTARPGDAGPSFGAIANAPQVTPLMIHVFLQTTHEKMPNLVLTKTEIDDVSEYILSFRPK